MRVRREEENAVSSGAACEREQRFVSALPMRLGVGMTRIRAIIALVLLVYLIPHTAGKCALVHIGSVCLQSVLTFNDIQRLTYCVPVPVRTCPCRSVRLLVCYVVWTDRGAVSLP